MIPTINKPTRVTLKTATAIDHIFKNFFTDTVFKTAIFKRNISDHFPICLMISSSMKQTNDTKTTVIFNRVVHTESIKLFKQKSYETSWNDIEASQNPDEVLKKVFEYVF